MSGAKLVPLDQTAVAPLLISGRLRSQLVYFLSPEGTPGVPHLQEAEFFFARDNVERWLDEGVMYLVSPLDTANHTEVELSEEQEAFLNWLSGNGVQHVRAVEL